FSNIIDDSIVVRRVTVTGVGDAAKFQPREQSDARTPTNALPNATGDERRLELARYQSIDRYDRPIDLRSSEWSNRGWTTRTIVGRLDDRIDRYFGIGRARDVARRQSRSEGRLLVFERPIVHGAETSRRRQ